MSESKLCPFCHRDTWHIGADGACWCDTCGVEINGDAASLITDMATKRACHNVSDWFFECSECGASIVADSYDEFSPDIWVENGQLNFCPNCGTMVVEGC